MKGLEKHFGTEIEKDVFDELLKGRDKLFSNYVIFLKSKSSKKRIEKEDLRDFKFKVLETWNEIYKTFDLPKKSIFMSLSLTRQGLTIPHKKIICELSHEIDGIERDVAESSIRELIERGWIEIDENGIMIFYDAYLEGKANFEKNIPKIVDVLYNLRKEIKEDILFSLRGIGNVFVENEGYRKNYLKEWEKICRTIIKLDPKDSTVHYNLGNLLKELGRKEEAEKEYREAIRWKPDYAMAYANLGFLYTQLGKIKEAIEMFEKALKFKDNLPDKGERIIPALEELKKALNQKK